MKRQLYWIWLSLICKQGTSLFSRLDENFESIDDIYYTEYDGFKKLHLFKKEEIDALCDKNLDEAEKIRDWCIEKGVGIIAYSDELYPERLRKIKNPPILLYYYGTFPNIDEEVCIAGVGSRKVSEYGKRVAYEISYDIAKSGGLIVSGMALGIDSVCHKAALDAGGKTVAVLGSGIDVIYPKEHRGLYKVISRNGAVITEFPPHTKPNACNFPIRNRIISGLSLGTVVFEADIKSGSMITARTSLEQGRDLFSVPGQLGEMLSRGTNKLISDGAQPVLTARDILYEYQYLYPSKLYLENIRRESTVSHHAFPAPNSTKRSDYSFASFDRLKKPGTVDGGTSNTTTQQTVTVPSDLSERQKKIFTLALSLKEFSADQLLACELNMSEILSELTILEIKGLVRALPGGLYQIA